MQSIPDAIIPPATNLSVAAPRQVEADPHADLNERFSLADLERLAVREIVEKLSSRLETLRSKLRAEEKAARECIDSSLLATVDGEESEISSLLANTAIQHATLAVLQRIGAASSMLDDYLASRERDLEGLPHSGGLRAEIRAKRDETENLRARAEEAREALKTLSVSQSHMVPSWTADVRAYENSLRELRNLEGSLLCKEDFELHDSELPRTLVLRALGVQRKR